MKYKATIKILGKTFKAEGTSVSEAISNLKVTNPKGKGILVVSNGDVSKEKILMPTITSRLFNTRGLSKEIATKQAATLFQGI